MRQLAFLAVFLGWFALAAEQPTQPDDNADKQAVAAKQKKPPKLAGPVAGAPQPPGVDVLAEAREMNSPKHPLPKPEFDAGHVETLEFDSEQINSTGSGFTIGMPSGTPVATPTVRDGRLFVSGGFSCTEFYCFDARTGKFIWGAELDDDGASAGVLHDDSIIFNTESCTIFSLAAATGKLRWAHWLGDPLMSIPTVAGGRVFTTYPVEDAAGIGKFTQPIEEAAEPDESKEDSESDTSTKDAKQIVPGHVLICLDAKTGKTLWQRWIDTECMSAPVADGERLYVTTYSGTVYEFSQADGKILAARRLRATSAPVTVAGHVYYTRRTDSGKKGQAVTEAIARLDRSNGLESYLTCTRRAPYLDWRIQVNAKSTTQALDFEKGNAIMGGFGGGFHSIPPEAFDQIEPADTQQAEPENNDEPLGEPSGGPGAPKVSAMEEPPSDQLAVTERVAAEVIGQGNVSMLQSYHGSRVLPLGDRLICCMGDVLVGVSATDGRRLWSMLLDGDLEEEGGYMASPPVAAGGQIFLATLAGEVLQIDPSDGKRKRTYKVGSPMRYPPAVVDGRIYATTQDGKVVCIDTGDRNLTGWPTWCHDPAHSNVAKRPR